MSEYKSPLEVYNDLKASGVPEDQAQMQGKQLGSVTNIVSELRQDMYWMRLIGGGMIVAFMGNIIAMWVKG